MNTLPLLAASSWGLVFGVALVMFVFLIVGYVVIQGTRVQLAWRTKVEEGDVDAIRTLVSEEVARWKSARVPKGTAPSVWHGVQSAELLDVTSDGIRLSAIAEGEYALVSGERREVSSALAEGMKLTAKLADIVLYDIPNVRLPFARIDIYSTYRDERGSSQRCILTTTCERAVGEGVDWEAAEPEEVVRAFGGRYRLDDAGRALPIDVEEPPKNDVPAAFYRE